MCAWIRGNSGNSSQHVMGQHWAGSGCDYTILAYGNYTSTTGSGGTTIRGASCSMRIDDWQHITLIKYSGKMYLYSDGNLVGSFFPIATLTRNYRLSIAMSANTGRPVYFAGYFNDFLLANYAIWTSNFTPPLKIVLE